MVVWYWTFTSSWSSWTARFTWQFVMSSCQRRRTRNVPLAKWPRFHVAGPDVQAAKLELLPRTGSVSLVVIGSLDT